MFMQKKPDGHLIVKMNISNLSLIHIFIGVHQHPVDQQLGQLGGQRVRIKECFGCLLAAVLSCLFVLFQLRLCQYCGIGVFVFNSSSSHAAFSAL